MIVLRQNLYSEEQPSDIRRKNRQAAIATGAGVGLSIAGSQIHKNAVIKAGSKRINSKFDSRISNLNKLANKEVEVANQGFRDAASRVTHESNGAENFVNKKFKEKSKGISGIFKRFKSNRLKREYAKDLKSIDSDLASRMEGQAKNLKATKSAIDSSLKSSIGKLEQSRASQVKRLAAKASNKSIRNAALGIAGSLAVGAYLKNRKTGHKSINDDNIQVTN